MNNDVEYILRLVLKARDDMTAVLAKARAEIRAFDDDIDSFNDKLETMNTRFRTIANNAKNMRKELGELKKASDDTGGSVRVVTVASEDLADATDRVAESTDRVTTAERERIKAGLDSELSTKRSARAAEATAAAKKSETEALKENTKEFDVNSAAVRKHAAEMGVDLNATTKALEVEKDLIRQRQDAGRALRNVKAELDLPKKGEIKDFRLEKLDSHQLETLTKAQERFNEARAAEVKQIEERERVQHDLQNSLRQSAAILNGEAEAIELATDAEEALTKSKVKSVKARQTKKKATEEETVAEKASTEATKKSAEADEEKTAAAKRAEKAAKLAAKEAKEEAVALKAEADAAEDSAERFAKSEEKKSAASKKRAKTRKELQEEANREMMEGIGDDVFGGRGEEDVAHLVNVERDIDIGDRFAEQGDFGGGPFSVGGGAPKKPEEERRDREARNKLIAKEREELRKNRTEYDLQVGALRKFFDAFKKGDTDLDTFVTKLDAFERRAASMRRKLAELTTLSPKQLQNLLDAPEFIREQLATFAGGKGFDPERREQLLRAIGKSDVGGGDAETVQKAATSQGALKKAVQGTEEEAIKLRLRMQELDQRLANGEITRKQAADSFQAIGNRLNQLSRKDPGSDISMAIGSIADRAHASAGKIRELSLSEEDNAKASGKVAQAHAALRDRADELLESHHRLMNDVRAGNVNWIQGRNQLTVYATAMQRLGKELHGVDDQREIALAGAIIDARRAITGFNQEGEKHVRVLRDIDHSTSGLAGRFRNWAEAADRAGGSVARVDNELRGMMVLAIMAFAEQLITAMVALGGVLGSVASSALFAGGAIGGALTAGIAQALPMLGLFVASFARVKEVMDAVNQAQLVDQQQFQRANDTKKKQADTSDALANAEDGVKNAEEAVGNAHRQLTEAQRNLTDARRDAERQLRDLIAAERQAELQARGAALAQTDAQEALRQAVAGGDVAGLAGAELDVLDTREANREAQQRLADARADRRRLVPRGIEGQDNVRQARQQVEDAKRAIDKADDGVTKATRSLEKAKRGSDMAAADSFAGLEKLQWLLEKRLSPAERELYERISKLQDVYRKNFRPITDIFITEYTRGVESVTRLLQEPRVLNSARTLAGGIATQMRALRRDFLGAPVVDQLVRINREGQKNLTPLRRIIQNIGHAILNIAEDSGPALRRLLSWFEGLSERILTLTSDDTKMGKFFDRAADNAIAWLNALEAIVRMLATLAGIAEGEGFSMLEDLTDWANRTTERIKNNRGEVAQFFKDSREVLEIFLKLIGQVAVAMLDIFNPDRLRVFGSFLGDTLLPALTRAVQLVGAFSTLILAIMNIPGLRQLTQLALTVIIITKLATSSATLFKLMAQQFSTFFTQWSRLRTLPSAFVAMDRDAKGFKGTLSGVSAAFKDLLTKIGILKREKIAPTVSTAGIPGRTVGGTTVGVPGRARTMADDLDSGALVPVPGGGVASKAEVERERIVQEERRRRRISGRGIARVGLIGAAVGGAVALSERDTNRNLRQLGTTGVGDIAIDQGKTFLGELGNMQFGTAIGHAKDAIFGGHGSGRELQNFAKTFNDEFTRMSKIRDISGLEKLGKHARDLAKAFPQYAEALNEASGRTDVAIVKSKDFNKQLDKTEDAAIRLNKEGIHVRIETRGKTPAKMLEDVEWFLRQLREGIPRNLGALNRDVQSQIERINSTFAQGGKKTPEWFEAMEKTYSLAIKNIRRLQREGKISAEDAGKAIDELRGKVERFRGDKPFSLGEDFARSIADTKGSRQNAINEVIGQLGQMPPAARRTAAEMAIGMIDRMAKKRPELKKTAERLKFAVGDEFRNMRDISTKRAGQLVRNTVGAIGTLPEGVGASLDILREMFKDALGAVGIKDVKWPAMARRTKGGKFTDIPGLVPLSDLGMDGAAQGARIGKKGMRGRDDRPTWLGDGELVLNHWKERAIDAFLPGQLTVDQIVNNIHGFHAGGFGSSFGFARGGRTGYQFAPIPGMPGEEANVTIIPLLERLMKRFHFIVTDAYDRDHSAGHKSPGHNVTGTAVDAVPGRGGSWNLIEALGRWAVSRSLTVGYGPGVPGSEPWPGHGRGNHIHIEFKPGMSAAGAGGFAGNELNIERALLGGPGGAAKRLGQGILDRVRKAANKYLRDASPDESFSFEKVSGGMGRQRVARVVNQAMDMLGIPKNIRANWRSMALDRAYQESGFNPNAQNNWDSNAAKGDPSRGLFQTIGSTFNAYKVRGHNNILGPLDNTLAAFKYMLAAYGHGSWALALSQMLGRRGVGYAMGGPVPGYGGGDQHPRWLEGGEHVWTKEEVQKAGGHGIMRALRRMLGGGKQGGPLGFQTGGDVQALDRPFTSAAELRRRRDVFRGAYALPAIPVRDWNAMLLEVRRVAIALTHVVSSWRVRVRQIGHEITQIGRQHERDIDKQIADLKKGGVTTKEAKKIRELRDEELSKKDKEEIKDLKEERENLRKNRGNARRRFREKTLLGTIDAVTREGGVIDTMEAARQRLTSLRTRSRTFSQFVRRGPGQLVGRDPSVSNVAIARSEMFSARADLEAIEDQERVVVNTRRKVNEQLQKLRRGGVTGKEAAQVRRLETQLSKLNEDFDSIRDAHAEALQAAYDAQVAAQQAAIDDINKRAESQTAIQEGVKRIASLFGNNSLVASVNQAERDILQTQADELERQIPSALAMGNQEMVDQLTQQVTDLHNQITESLAQSLRDAADQINQSAQRRLGRLDLFGRMQTAIGKMGLNSIVNVGGEAFSAAGVQAQRTATLENQRTGLQGLLQQVMREQPQNVQLIQDLTDQLADLDVTIQENTKAWFDARVADVNAIFGRGSTTLDLRKQIVEAQGAISGTTDNAALLALERERTTLLTNQATALTALLDEARRVGDDQAINDLTDQLLGNQIATLQNTKSINDLTGLTTQPQGFSSSAWQWFRQAIFTGMGDVLPRYVVPGAASGAIVTKSGLAMVHTGEPIVPARLADADFGSGNSGDINIEINEAGGPIDYVHLASTVAWAKQTAQRPRK